MAQHEGCLVCDNPNVEWHHVFHGTANRKRADIYGYVVPLCREHHTGPTGVHFQPDMDRALKEAAQADYETRYGSREEFIKIFGRNYL